MEEVERAEPDVGAKLRELTGASFDALADWMDSFAPHEDEYWTVAWAKDGGLTTPWAPAVMPLAAPVDEPTQLTDVAASEVALDESLRHHAEAEAAAVDRALGALAETIEAEFDSDRAEQDTCECPEPPDRQVLERALQQRLREWAEPYHLHRDPWVLDHAVRLLQDYRIRCEDGGVPEPLRLGTHVAWVSYAPPSGEETLPIGHARPRSFHPDQDTPARYLAHIKRHMDARAAVYESAGFEQAPNRKVEVAHLRWLVKHQVQGLSYKALARAATTNDSTIRRAIKNLAADLQLTLREDVPGRG